MSSSSIDKGAKRKSRKERENEWKVDGSKKIGGVDFTSALVDRQVGDVRYERDRAQKLETQEKGVAALKESRPAVSATFDAFQRMAAGLEGRSIADKQPHPAGFSDRPRTASCVQRRLAGAMRPAIEYGSAGGRPGP